MTRETIMQELKNRGYEVEAVDTVRNGITFHGITIGTERVRPTLYMEKYEDYSDAYLKEVVDDIVEKYNEAKGIEFDITNIFDWNVTKDKLQLCVQRPGTENIVKREYLDLETYVRIRINEEASIKITPEHMPLLNVSEEVLFKAAWENTQPEIVIHKMSDTLPGMDFLEIPATKQIYVASNKMKSHGAIALLDIDKLTQVADLIGTDFYIVPSSIHEVLLYPVAMIDKDELNALINDVNSSELLPEEILSNHAYRFDKASRQVISV